jgi:hypothetical protein
MVETSPAARPLAITVITPSYNYEHYLRDCLESVRRQTAAGVTVQHVVVDDGSTDRSWEVICAHHAGPATDRLRQENAGLSAALNRAFRQATGDWVLWLNADDFLLPRAFELYAAALAAVPDADLVFGDTVFVDAQARLLRLVAQPSFDRALFEGGYNSFHVPSVLWPRERLADGRFDESMKLLMDLDLWLGLTPPGTVVAKVDAPLAAFRRHTAQTSASARPSDAEEMRRLAQRHRMVRLLEASSSAPLPSAKVRHGLLKLKEGAWLREAVAMRRRGERLDWTNGRSEAAEALVPATPRVRRAVSAGRASGPTTCLPPSVGR